MATAESSAASRGKLERAAEVAARLSSLNPADPRVRRGLHAAIATAVLLSVALGVVAAVGNLPTIDWNFRPAAIAAALLGFSLCLIAHAELWRRILAALGPELPPRRAAAIWFTSGLGRYAPASVLMPLLRVAMAEREGVSKRITLASFVYEMSLFYAAALLVGAYFVIQLPELQGQPWRYLVGALPLIALILLQPRFFHTVADRILMRLGRERLPRSLPGAKVLELVGLYALTFVMTGLGVYALALNVYPLDAGDLPVAVGAFAVGTTLSLVAVFVPGGLIAREAGLAVALAPLMPAAPAIAIAILVRIAQLGLEILGATISPLLARGERPAAGGG